MTLSKLTELLGLMPRPIQIALAGILLGGIAFAGHEVRYMTVSQFTKSYVLDLRSEIRALARELTNPDIDSRTRRILQEQLDQMIDELCYEVPDDPYCKNRQ